MLQRKPTGRDVIPHTESMQSQLKQIYKAVHVIPYIENTCYKETNKQTNKSSIEKDVIPHTESMQSQIETNVQSWSCYPAHRKYTKSNEFTSLSIISHKENYFLPPLQ